MSNSEHINGMEFDKEIYKAMKTAGWLFPETPSEVESAEQELELNPMELPNSIKDASKAFEVIFLSPADNLLKSKANIPLNNGIRTDLARAAREGGDISEELAKRMREDRKKARDEMNGK